MAYQPFQPVYKRTIGITLAEPLAMYLFFLISFYPVASTISRNAVGEQKSRGGRHAPKVPCFKHKRWFAFDRPLHWSAAAR
jgi:hypothetical protein